MSIDPNALENLSRDELIARARQLGAKRPELLTRPELRDEIIRLSMGDEEARRRARGWFGVARDLVASVVSQGLNLPDTADLIRGVHVLTPRAAPPVATVTLAEIYAAQGHVSKALDLLDEVIAKEPDHEAARQARERWGGTANVTDAPSPDKCAVGDPKPNILGPDEPTPNAPAPNEPEPNEPVMQPAPDAKELVIQSALETSEIARVKAVQGQNTQAVVPATGEASSVATPVQVTGEDSDEAPLTPNVIERSQVAPVIEAIREPTTDRVCVVRAPPQGILVHFQVTAKTMQRVRAKTPHGALMLRMVEVERSWDGPRSIARELPLAESVGQVHLDLQSTESEVRVAIGWFHEPEFTVLALGAEFDWDGVASRLRWAPPATIDNAAWDAVGSVVVRGMMQ